MLEKCSKYAQQRQVQIGIAAAAAIATSALLSLLLLLLCRPPRAQCLTSSRRIPSEKNTGKKDAYMGTYINRQRSITVSLPAQLTRSDRWSVPRARAQQHTCKSFVCVTRRKTTTSFFFNIMLFYMAIALLPAPSRKL